MMNITSLSIECDEAGTKVSAWVKCRSVGEVEALRAWLLAASRVMDEWRDIRETLAESPAANNDNVTTIKPKRPEPAK